MAGLCTRLVVPGQDAGQRLDVWLESQLEGFSRSLLARCIREERCVIKPGKAKTGYRLRGGEIIDIEVPDLELPDIVPEDIPLQVLYEDADLLIVDKPAGMVVHPAIGHPRGTLLAAALGRALKEGSCAPALIHRLDADTSGLIALARHAHALAFFQEQFRERSVEKHYFACCAGNPTADWWSCKASLGRHRKDFRKRCVVPCESPGARSAHSDFRVLFREAHFCGLAVRIHSGRTHQIRVHAAHSGHAVLADSVYGRHAQWPPQGSPLLTRQALHAWALRLRLPNGKDLSICAPIPADLQALIGDRQLPEPLLMSC